MNARIALQPEWDLDQAPGPEAIDLLRRALALSVTVEEANRLLGRTQADALWPSAVYEELAKQEAYRYLTPRTIFHNRLSEPGEKQRVVNELEALLQLRDQPSSDYLASLIIRILSQCAINDHVLFRRLGQELDAMAYRFMADSNTQAGARVSS